MSSEQKAWAEDKISAAGLADRIEIRLQDYRETAETFDAVASVEMVEAVGQRWWGAYLDCIARNLAPGGRAALQFIAMDHRLFDSYARNPDFIQTYIFPGGILLDEPRFAGAGGRARTVLGGPRGLPPRLCRDPETLARPLRRGGGTRRSRRIRRAVPQSVALLSDVLRGRLQGRRDRRRPGDDGQSLKAIYDRPRALSDGLAAIRTQFQLQAAFPPDAEAAAEPAARQPPSGTCRPHRASRSSPSTPSSTDLDQAFAIEQSGSDLVLRYAIADVGWFVADGGPVDTEAWVRGETIYMPDGKISLYPAVLCEGAASLLPDGDKPAILFAVRVASDGAASLDGAERAIDPQPRQARLCDGSARGFARRVRRAVAANCGRGAGARRLARRSAATAGRRKA